jgi:hypothetical protein
MKKAGKTIDVKVYPGVGHAFGLPRDLPEEVTLEGMGARHLLAEDVQLQRPAISVSRACRPVRAVRCARSLE